MIKLLQKKDFHKVYELMEISFPVDEHRPYDEQKALLSVPEYKIYIKENENGLIAFIAVWEFEEFIFVEHFAVNPQYRGAGIGASMLCDMAKFYDKILILEVELPYCEMAKRRIGFYERNGFFYNQYDYIQPPISHGLKPVPLRIMTYGRSVCEEDFCRMRDLLYTKVYKVK